MSSSFALELQDIRKRFGDFWAVQGITCSAVNGEVLSLLGPNGAGKSTTISMISGLLEPTSGDALVMGHSVRKDPAGAKSVLGVVPQDVALYPDLTARENLVFWGKMYGLRGQALNVRVAEVLEVIGLTDRQKDRVGTFSGGMKRRVNIGAALLHKPQMVIMDEPTVGIDPQSRRHILDNVKELNRAGMTVLYTTHYMEEAEELSDHIAIVDQGRLVAYGTHAELIRLVGEQTRLELMVNVEAGRVIPAWEKTDGVGRVSGKDGKITVLVDDSNRVLPKLFDAANRIGARITSVDIEEPNLEAVFLHLTGKALRD
ncbi:MAG TPA: ATP-binding cassette domain-containing protein [Anaerolineaceae bacterium]